MSAKVTKKTAIAESVAAAAEVLSQTEKKTSKPEANLKPTTSKTKAAPVEVVSESAPKVVSKVVPRASAKVVVKDNAVEQPVEAATKTTAKPATKTTAKLATKTELVSKAALKVVSKSPTITAKPKVTIKTTSVAVKPKTRLTVTRGNVVLLTAGGKKVSKEAVKSPAKTPAKTKAKKSPAKTTAKTKAKKSPAKSGKIVRKPATKGKGKAATKVGGKRVAAKGKAKEEKQRRPYNTKPAPIDYAGIGIGSAKVKKVLMHVAFNPAEFRVRKNLALAENKPVRPKPTKEVPNPEMPEQGKQTDVSKMNKADLKIIRDAEAAHERSLTEDYEHAVVSLYHEEKNPWGCDKERVEAYNTAKKAATKESVESSTKFVLRNFNLSFDKNFYANQAKYATENDSYALGRIVKDKKGVEKERFNQWTRAMALVNKTCIRLSNGVRDILACYLDNLVKQYARNGIYNCIAENHSNLQLRHALTPSEGFSKRVPLDSFVRTLDGYSLALDWVEACKQTRDEVADLKDKLKKGKLKGDHVEYSMPDYPDPKYDENFEGYVVEICRSVRMVMAEEQTVLEDKELYHNIKISDNFKKFCSIIIYEAILRIGYALKETVALVKVKTVSAPLMFHVLKQVSCICGPDFTPIKKDVLERYERFTQWCAERRVKRSEKREEKKSKAAAGETVEDSTEADVEDHEEQEELEQELEQEEELDVVTEDQAEAENEAANEEEQDENAEEQVEEEQVEEEQVEEEPEAEVEEENEEQVEEDVEADGQAEDAENEE